MQLDPMKGFVLTFVLNTDFKSYVSWFFLWKHTLFIL